MGVLIIYLYYDPYRSEGKLLNEIAWLMYKFHLF